MKYKVVLTLYLLTGIVVLPQSDKLNKSLADSFVNCLLNNPDSLHYFVMPEELALSERLGITYSGVKNKFLISNDIDEALRTKSADGSLKYDYNITALNDGYAKISLSFKEMNYTHEYYFYNNYLVSPTSYFAKSWKNSNSRYFNFVISNPEYFNSYSAERLDRFVDSVSKFLNFSDELKERLSKEKIFYYLYANEDEIQNLTGFKTMGMYYLPYDYVITTYNCHYHELLHLLINYKLQNNALYTHPFLQEGFAVALGGRGGKEPPVILDMGAYLQNSGFMDYTELLSREQFLSNDASMSYPVSGLYNLFLLNNLGIDKYLTFYRKYSSGDNEISKMIIDSTDLPGKNEWLSFLNEYQQDKFIRFPEKYMGDIIAESKDKNYSISKTDVDYFFLVKDTVLLKGKEVIPGYKSKAFKELFPNRIYKGEKYAVVASDDEVSVYNLYTNNLMAKYVRSFSMTQLPVKVKDGCHFFAVSKEIFEEEISAVE